MSTGLRYNQGKMEWGLINYKAMEPMIKVLMYGAKKYTKKLTFTLENIRKVCDSAKIIQIEKLSQEDFVGLATIENSSWQTRTIEEDNQRMLLHGELEIQKEPRSWSVLEKLGLSPLSKERETEEKRMKHGSIESMGSPPISTNLLDFKDVLFADQRNVYMLITATKQENSEEFFVVSATKDLDCLMMIFQELKQRKLILKDTQIIDGEIVVSGKGNWQKGLSKREILESMQRHLAALLDGQEIDPESGLDHIGHIGCNYLFYSYFTTVDPTNARD